MAPGKQRKSASKSKGGKNGAGSKSKENQPASEIQDDNRLECKLELSFEEQVPYIKAFWNTVSEAEQQELLTIGVAELRQKALQLSQACLHWPVCTAERATLRSKGKTLVEALEQGIERLINKPAGQGWKVWRWPNMQKEWLDARSFRHFADKTMIDLELRKFLPEGDAMKAEAEALQGRLAEVDLRVKVSESMLMGAGPTVCIADVVEFITTVLAAFEQEHPYLYNFILSPIKGAVCKALPRSRRSTSEAHLSYCDLEKLPQEILLNICDWLHTGVGVLSRTSGARLFQNGPTHEGDNSEDVVPWDFDKFYVPPHDSSRLQVDPLWQEYLQGHMHVQFSSFCEGKAVQELAQGVAFVLEWVFERVKPDADSYRVWIQSSLGTWVPTVEKAHSQLLVALKDMHAWQDKAETCKTLLHDMLVSRRNMAQLGAKYDISPRPDRAKNMHPCELPDHVVVALLKREALLTRVRLHTARIQQIMNRERLTSLQTKQLQGEPKFERWKAELEAPYKSPQLNPSAKQPPRTHAGMVVDHPELTEKFESLGATLREYEAQEKQLAIEMGFRDEEIKQYSVWSDNTLNMATTLQDVTEAEARPLAEGFQKGSICPCCNSSTCTSVDWGRSVAEGVRQEQAKQLRKTADLLKQAFQTDVRYQLHDDAEDHRLYRLMQSQLKLIEKRQQEGQAVLPFLHAYMLNLACDDPGTIIGPQLVLPMLQERLLARASAFHERQAVQNQQEAAKQREAAALLASQDLLAEEERERARGAAKKAKKDKAKAKKQPPQEVPLSQPHEEPSTHPDEFATSAFAEASSEPAMPLTSSALTEDVHDIGQPPVQADATSSAAFNGDSSDPDQAQWHSISRKGSDLPARIVMAPPKVVEAVQVEPALLSESSSCSAASLPWSSAEDRLLHLLMCPITQAPIDDPVIAADGHTYEKAAMQKWLEHRQTSPVTGETLKHVRLVPNIVIKSVIQQQLL